MISSHPLPHRPNLECLATLPLAVGTHMKVFTSQGVHLVYILCLKWYYSLTIIIYFWHAMYAIGIHASTFYLFL